MILVCKQPTDGALNDGALPRHQPFTNPMARFGGDGCFDCLSLTGEGGGVCPFLMRIVIFTVIFSFQRPLSDNLGG